MSQRGERKSAVVQLCEVKDAENLESDRMILINESMELVKIFSSIVNNSNVD